MRWSEWMEKECIDLVHGSKLGNFMHADLTFQMDTGKIERILIPLSHSWFKKPTQYLELSWKMVKKVGPEMVIVDTRERG